MELLAEHGVELEGRRAVVIGRSQIVGKPMAHLLLAENATVTICHSRTGRPRLAHPRGRRPRGRRRPAAPRHARHGQAGAAVVDVGITRLPRGARGDVDPAVAEVAGHLTPVPGGVGPMTIAILLRNTVLAARYRRGIACVSVAGLGNVRGAQ